MAEILFEWDEANLEHLETHGFSREDAEAAIIDPKRVSSFAKQDGGREKRFGVVGRGAGGDILHVVFVIRDGRVRPFHLREANLAEKRRCRR